MVNESPSILLREQLFISTTEQNDLIQVFVNQHVSYLDVGSTFSPTTFPYTPTQREYKLITPHQGTIPINDMLSSY